MPIATSTEYLSIAGIPLHTAAWIITDLAPLWDGAEVRGADRLLPGVVGVKAYKRRATVTRKALPIVIFGDFDSDGVAQANTRAGLWNNVAFLRANIVDPLATGNGTRTAVLTRPGGTTTAAVHVLSPMRLVPFGPSAVRGVLELSIPSGAFA